MHWNEKCFETNLNKTRNMLFLYVLRNCDINRKECKRHNPTAMRAFTNLCIQQSVAEESFLR